MRIRVAVTVIVDPKDWANDYSMTDTSLKAVRADVRSYVELAVRGSFAAEQGLLAIADPELLG